MQGAMAGSLDQEACRAAFQPYLKDPDWSGPGPLQVTF